MKRIMLFFLVIIAGASAVFVSSCRTIIIAKQAAYFTPEITPCLSEEFDTVLSSLPPEETMSIISRNPSPTLEPTPEPTAEPYEGQLISEYALQFLGYDYNYGGASPQTGFDCSGLVYYVYRQFGYRISRVAEYQAKDGLSVNSTSELLPGDVICFSWHGNSYVNHAGIYIGEGQFIHAMDSAHDVLITSLEDYLETHDWIGRRIIGSIEKKSKEEIESEEKAEWAYAAQQAAYAAANPTPSPTPYTPPPSTIPVPVDVEKQEAEARRQAEIEAALEEMRADLNLQTSSASDAESSEEVTQVDIIREPDVLTTISTEENNTSTEKDTGIE